MLNNLNLEDVPYNKEERIPDSIAQELDFWEKAVFSFDMDRNSSAGGSSSSSGANDPGAHRGEAERRRQDGTRHPNSSTAASGTGETSLGVHQTPTLHELLNMHTQQSTAQGMAPLTQVPQQPGQPGMLDPYTLAHLAALSALTSPGVSSQQQQSAGGNGSQADPFAVLRQVQSLLYPYGPPSHGAGPSLPLTGMSQNYQPMHPHGVQQGPPGSALPAQIPNRPGNTTTSGQPWPAYPNANQMYPPIDPALFEQYPHLLSLMPTTGQAQQAQTPGAGPSSISGNRRSPSVPTANAASPQSPANQTQDETVVSEDKRRRNTAASARFRVKKKHKVLSLERSVVELETRAEDLEREAAELRRENGWLKEMLIMKGRGMRSSKQRAKQDQDEDEGEETAEESDTREDDGESSEKTKGKGKEKEK